MNTARKTKRIAPFVLAIGLQSLLLVPASAGPQSGADYHVDYSVARKEIQGFENVINNLLSATFTNPYALVQRTKGVYLQGYGLSFNFLINIHRAVVNTPFGEARTGPDITPEQKRKRIEDLKDKLVRVLIDNGDNLRQLRRDETVTIVAFFEDKNFPDEENQNKTVVMSVSKKDLDELAHQDARIKEFKQRMRIIEY